MKIEEGKVYKRRDGLKAFDIEIRNGLAYYSFELNGNIRSAVVFESSGSLSYDSARFPFSDDLIEEWKEEKMPKFKVGDFVTADGWSNPKGHEIKKIDDGNYWLADSSGGLSDYSIERYDSKLKFVTQTPKSPVVEKTVKSIEPGVYGRVAVTGCYKNENKIVVHLADSVGEYEQYDAGMIMTSEELESAAKTFMELSEYLRGRG